jgi:hypothetical protein
MPSNWKAEINSGGICEMKKDKIQNPNRGHFRPGFLSPLFQAATDSFYAHLPLQSSPL